MILRSVLSIALLALSPKALAEGGCPAGYVPMQEQYQDPASGTLQVRTNCVPGGGASEPTQPSAAYADRWGAIAIDGSVSAGGIGTVTDLPSKKKAEKAALSQCRATGGGKGCEVYLSYQNQCAVIASGDRYIQAFGGAAIESASERALGACKQRTTNCSIYYSGCSYPVRIR